MNGVLPVILYASILAALTGIALIITKRIKRKDAMPLAPFLYLGILAAVYMF
jgi:prepilin signal peptidase PulO-like enzyme (type II secretory pathway)